MSYAFGTEIAQFTLKIYQPGDEVDLFEDAMGRALNPDTFELLEDDGNTDEYTELLPKQRPDDQFEPQRVKVLKPMWVIELQHFPQGGLDYERLEGCIRELVNDWAVEAAGIFREKVKPPAAAPQEQPQRWPGEIAGSFYAVFHSSWSGGGGYFDDEPDFELEFLGELADIVAK
jgi:hypothetical protein